MKAVTTRRLRLVTQCAFFGLFLWLLFRGRIPRSFQLAGGESPAHRQPLPEADPFVAC